MTSTDLSRRDWLPYAVGALAVAFAAVLLAYPIGRSVLVAFVRNGADLTFANLTFANFERFFVSASYKRALVNSLVAGGLSTLAATLLALPMAYAVARVAIPFRSLIMAISVVPLISPPFIGSYAWIMLLGNNGIISNMLRMVGIDLPSIYGPFGVVFALAMSYFPYVFLVVQGALAGGDPYVEEAARMMGASRWHILRTITFPSILPSIAAGMLIVFIKAIGDFGVPSILGGEFQVLPTLIYYQIHGFHNLSAASAIAMVNVAMTLLALAFLARINRRKAYATISGIARAAARLDGAGARIFANAYTWGLLFVAALPQAVILMASFAVEWPGTLLPTAYGFAQYVSVSKYLVQPIVNSLILSGTATLLCVVFGIVSAYAVVRDRIVGKWAVDALIMLPFVLPGLVVGVAYLTAFNDGVLILTGTGTIVVLAYFTRRVAFIFRSASVAIGRIDPKIEEASTMCGAGWGSTMWRVTIPLIVPGILAGSILVFATLIGEISATVLLYSASWKTISISIYEFVLGGELYRASALGTVTTVLTLTLVLLASRLVGKNMADMFQ
jgi:iron(III) transport system permease protein